MAPVVIKNFQLSSYKRPSIAPALSPVEKVEMFAQREKWLHIQRRKTNNPKR